MLLLSQSKPEDYLHCIQKLTVTIYKMQSLFYCYLGKYSHLLIY